MTIAQGSAFARRVAGGNKYGYSRNASKVNGRWSGLYHEPGNFDCTSFCGAVGKASGFLTDDDLKGTFFSGNIINRLVASGMYYSISIGDKSFAEQKKLLKEGDIVRGVGHGVYALGDGKVASFEQSEHGTTHGKVGDQTGREGRIRDFYPRSRKWSHIARPHPFSTHLGRAIADYDRGRSQKTNRNRMVRRAPWDGPRMIEFLDLWAKLDQGMTFWYDPDKMPWPSVPEGHIFVVLGSGLKADGTMTAKFERRLKLVLPILLAHPDAKVLVTGGKPRNGISEGMAGRRWLMDHGVLEENIAVETKSTSTIGNAKYSVEFMALNEFTSYTLVSDVQHLRRAQIEFHAAQAAREIVNNGRIKLTAGIPLAFNNYGSKTVAPEKPVSAATRHAVANEVAILLGVQTSYQKAL